MPDYEVVTKAENRELRKYSGYIVAKTYVEGKDYDEAQGKAFRILANYIFGDNETKSDIEMTAPVVQKPAQSTEIAMTAPVVQTADANGWTMTFMMPRKYTLETLPVPKDDRVKFEQVEPKLMATIEFTWWSTESRNEAHARELRNWIETSLNQYKIISGPMYAGYDPPWTIPFLKRHEMQYELVEN